MTESTLSSQADVIEQIEHARNALKTLVPRSIPQEYWYFNNNNDDIQFMTRKRIVFHDENNPLPIPPDVYESKISTEMLLLLLWLMEEARIVLDAADIEEKEQIRHLDAYRAFQNIQDIRHSLRENKLVPLLNTAVYYHLSTTANSDNIVEWYTQVWQPVFNAQAYEVSGELQIQVLDWLSVKDGRFFQGLSRSVHFAFYFMLLRYLGIVIGFPYHTDLKLFHNILTEYLSFDKESTVRVTGLFNLPQLIETLQR